MIRFENKAGTPEVVVWSEAPLIYMDNWALHLFSTDSGLQMELLDLFKDRGTLAISLMSVVEIGAHEALERPNLRSFLKAIGPHWIPLTNDPFKVMAAQEEADPDIPGACLATEFMKDPDLSAKLCDGDLTLVHIIDLTRGDVGAKLKERADYFTKKLCEGINDRRREYAADPNTLDDTWPNLRFDPKAWMRPIYNAFLRLCVKDSFDFDDNHARDLEHAITSVGCAQMTLLDPHWVNQARKVKKLIEMPADLVRIYAKSDVRQFLTDVGTFPPSRGRCDPAI